MESFKFDPITDAELEASQSTENQLAENGIYDFEIMVSKRTYSKAGNEMSKLKLRITDKNGKQYIVWDNLVFSDSTFCRRKIKHFCQSIGLIEECNRGELPAELGGYSGKCEIGYQDKQPNDEGGYYPAKNIVVDYIKDDNAKPKTEFLNEDILF